MNHHPLSAGPTRLLVRLLRAGMLALAVSLAACGGGGGDGVAAPPEFDVVSGGAACGTVGCNADSADGGGAGGDGGGGGGDGSAGDGAGGGLGAMRNVRVTARKPSGTVLGTAVLANNLVSLYARTYKDAFILEFADDGSGTGEYYDEATRSWIRLNAQALHILVPKLTHHVSANPLTEAAYQWALNKYGTESALNAVRMAEANEAVRQAFNARVPTAYQLSDITNYATAVSDTTVANSLPNTHAGRFGTLLAAMPRAARTFLGSLPSPALAFTRQLVKDIRDDGVVNASTDDAEPKTYDGTLAQLLFDAILDARAEYGVGAQPAPAEVPNVCFNPALFKKGTKWSLEFLDTPFDTSPSSSTLDLEVTSDTAVFQKYGPALEVKQVFSNPNGSVTSFQYIGTDLGAGITSYGSRQAVVGQGAGLTFENLVDPPSVNRQFLLRPGESDTVTQTITSSYFNADGTPFTQLPPTTQTLTETTTFVGFETVTVPAGTFKNACKYVTVDQFENVTTTWITSSGQGVPVRNASNSGDLSELLPSSTVNGVPVK